ncbi:hypothetical protein ACWIFB_05195 [Dietzia sp. NPDC055340]
MDNTADLLVRGAGMAGPTAAARTNANGAKVTGLRSDCSSIV